MADVETRGQKYDRLVRSMTHHTLLYEGTKTSPLSEDHLRAKEGLAAVRDEFRHTFLKGDGFDDIRERAFRSIVVGRVEAHNASEREKRYRGTTLTDIIDFRRRDLSDDWTMLNREFPGQYDYELQSEIGDAPPLTGRERK